MIYDLPLSHWLTNIYVTMTHCTQIQDLMGTFEEVFAEDPANDLAATHRAVSQ